MWCGHSTFPLPVSTWIASTTGVLTVQRATPLEKLLPIIAYALWARLDFYIGSDTDFSSKTGAVLIHVLWMPSQNTINYNTSRTLFTECV